jgi:DNA-binding LytR/AlgR family response regulator
MPQLDPQRFWQVHRGTIVQARCIAQARREESGRVTLMLRGRPETLTVSRLYAHLFKGQ